MSKRALTTLSAVFLFWAMAPGPASAQEQTFHACYVPEVGAMYLIGLSGLPTECLSSEHVEISWTEGGATVTDHGELTGLSDDDHPEYVREGEPAGGDLAGTFPDPSVAALRGNALSSTAPSDGQVLIWNNGATEWEPQAPPSGVTDHGNLTGLTDDDHPQYLLTDGTRALTGNLSVADHRISDVGAATDPGDAVPFEQAVKSGDAAAGDLGGTFPDPSVAGLQGHAVSSTAPSDGQVLIWNDGATTWEPQAPPSGVTDHGNLSGLTDDDHAQYLLTDGVRDATDGFAVTGTLNTGVIPTEGAGTRMMWYPAKAAFRAGEVPGSEWDDANVGDWSVAFGSNTTASGDQSTAMGANTTASALRATAMGGLTTASGSYSTAMGLSTTASNAYSTAMGSFTIASGDRSTAMGAWASTNGYDGTFVYGDASTTTAVQASTTHQFVVRAQHIWLGTDPNNVSNPTGHFLTTSTGAFLSTGGTWTDASSRAVKENFRVVDPGAVLEQVARLPVQRWNYRAESSEVEHIGPMAEDFHAAFGLGADDEHIAPLDVGGVALLSIQALEKRTREQAETIEALRSENAEQRERIDRLEALVEQVIESEGLEVVHR